MFVMLYVYNKQIFIYLKAKAEWSQSRKVDSIWCCRLSIYPAVCWSSKVQVCHVLTRKHQLDTWKQDHVHMFNMKDSRLNFCKVDSNPSVEHFPCLITESVPAMQYCWTCRSWQSGGGLSSDGSTSGHRGSHRHSCRRRRSWALQQDGGEGSPLELKTNLCVFKVA